MYSLGVRARRDNELSWYTIQDYLTGLRIVKGGSKAFDHERVVLARFDIQFQIVSSAKVRFDSSLSDIKGLVQADLFDSELEGSRELLANGFVRAAGVIAGVVLERHLSQVLGNHGLGTRKKTPTIADFNDLLKEGGVLDTPSWRQVQRLGDLRNLCGHDKGREPETEEVEELIDGVEKYTKTLF